jgi:hypothetical protein
MTKVALKARIRLPNDGVFISHTCDRYTIIAGPDTHNNAIIDHMQNPVKRPPFPIYATFPKIPHFFGKMPLTALAKCGKLTCGKVAGRTQNEVGYRSYIVTAIIK